MVESLTPIADSPRSVRRVCLARSRADEVYRIRSYESRIRSREIQYTIQLAEGSFHSVHNAGFTKLIKGDMRWLYNERFKNGAEGAKIKARILELSEDYCPFCYGDIPTTIEHMIAVSSDPWLAVDPRNMAPCCPTCNEKRGAGDKNSSVNPYFDQWASDTVWLKADLRDRTDPASILFAVRNDAALTPAQSKLIQTHFEERKLRKRFATRAGRQLAELRTNVRTYVTLADSIGHTPSPGEVRSEVERELIKTVEGRTSDYGPNYCLAVAAACWLSNLDTIDWVAEASRAKSRVR